MMQLRVDEEKHGADEGRRERPSTPVELRPGRPEAARASWDWSGEERRRRAEQHVRAARKRGAVALLVGGCVSAAVAWKLSAHVGAAGGAVAATIFFLSLASPTRGFAFVERVLASFSKGVGVVLAWLLLVPVFFLFFVPFKLLRKARGVDPLSRTLEPEARSYWIERARERDPSSYENQF